MYEFSFFLNLLSINLTYINISHSPNAFFFFFPSFCTFTVHKKLDIPYMYILIVSCVSCHYIYKYNDNKTRFNLMLMIFSLLIHTKQIKLKSCMNTLLIVLTGVCSSVHAQGPRVPVGLWPVLHSHADP